MCATAGVRGGPTLATEAYGAKRATEADKIRAARTVREYCAGGTQLPAEAPPKPF